MWQIFTEPHRMPLNLLLFTPVGHANRVFHLCHDVENAGKHQNKGREDRNHQEKHPQESQRSSCSCIKICYKWSPSSVFCGPEVLELLLLPILCSCPINSLNPQKRSPTLETAYSQRKMSHLRATHYTAGDERAQSDFNIKTFSWHKERNFDLLSECSCKRKEFYNNKWTTWGRV